MIKIVCIVGCFVWNVVQLTSAVFSLLWNFDWELEILHTRYKIYICGMLCASMGVTCAQHFLSFPVQLGDQPNPAPAGQVDYTKAWEEYYKKMGMC